MSYALHIPQCPRCNSTEVSIRFLSDIKGWVCSRCVYRWPTTEVDTSMITSTITLVPRGRSERVTYSITITNDLTGTAERGNYLVVATAPDGTQYHAQVKGYRRAQKNGMARLVMKAIDALFPYEPENRYLHGELSERLAQRDGWSE